MYKYSRKKNQSFDDVSESTNKRKWNEFTFRNMIDKTNTKEHIM